MKALLGTALVVALAAAGPGMAQNNTRQMKQPDQDFLTKASESNISEMKIGQLAQQAAQNPQVKQFAQRMVADHRKAQQQLLSAMQNNGVVVPDHVSKDGAGLYDKLAKESGPQFDRDYVKSMVGDHKDDVSDFKDEAKNGKDRTLQQYAQQTLPTIQQHLQMAQKLDQTTKNEGK